MEEKIKKVMSDEAYVKELLALETPEEVQASLEEKDIEMSLEEIKQAINLLSRYSEGELSEDELSEVAGGDLCTVCLVIGIASWVVSGTGFTDWITRRRW